MKRNCIVLAATAAVCSVAAFAADGLEQRIALVKALKGGEVSSLTATLHTKADPEGKDPLAIWRAEAAEKVALKDAFVRVDFTLVPEQGSDIKCRAELPLPEKWDGRIWGQGNSGRAGSIRSLAGYVASGTAAVTTDLGTSAVVKGDRHAPWPECVKRDFHWRATHLMTVYGKRIVEAFYGRPAKRAYFAGGSTGGRQAMSEAIRFPGDYDGLLVSLPDSNAAANEIAIWHLWRQTHDAGGNLLFTTNAMRVVADAAVEYRKAADPAPYAGRALADARFSEREIDGFLALAAKKRPELAGGDRMARLKSLYMPLMHDGRCYFNGYAPGSYLGRNMEWKGLVSISHFLGGKGVDAEKWKDAGWSEIDAYLRECAPEFNASSPDLSAFKARGGKIIMSLGWEDQTVPPAPVLDYYERVCERDGGIDCARKWFRLFCIPGCAHGGGRGRIMTGTPNGAAVRKMLVDWREKGKAPERLDSSVKKKGLDMPVAPYPEMFVKGPDGQWHIEQVKRGVARIDAQEVLHTEVRPGSCAATASALPAARVFAGDADAQPLRLSPAKIPACKKAYVCRDLQYGERQVGKGAAQANVAQTYDLYLPGNLGEIERSAPFYLFVHGGAWKRGGKAGSATRLCAEMAEEGFVVASMNYVLCNIEQGEAHTFAEMLADIDAMVSHVPGIAKAAGISIPRIAIGGSSAGGHLSLLYAYDGANPSVLGLGLKHAVPVACVFSDCGPSDIASPEFIVAGLNWMKGSFEDWYGLLCVLAGGKFGQEDVGTTVERLARHSPITLVNGKCPPTICLFGATGSVKTTGRFKRAKDGPTETYADFWKLAGSKETPPESVGMDGIVATQNYVTLTNGLSRAGVPFAARLEPYPHCRILSRKPETRQWLFENLRKYLKGNEAKRSDGV